jgi:hypothetical protein
MVRPACTPAWPAKSAPCSSSTCEPGVSGLSRNCDALSAVDRLRFFQRAHIAYEELAKLGGDTW